MLLRSILAVVLAPVVLVPIVSAQTIPAPQEIAIAEPRAVFATETVLVSTDDALDEQVDVLVAGLERLGTGSVHRIELHAPVRFRQEDVEGAATHVIRVHEEGIDVVAESPVAAAHAVTTLLQLVSIDGAAASWPCLTLRDGPDLDFRCFMVDLGRNPHGPTTLRQVVDVLAFYKVNLLQLHLGDDQLWSFPSTAFPKLLDERAGWNREDFVALEAYARARGVAIVPELDVPGHSTLLRRRYPDVFGETPTELATSEVARAGLETLLGEMIDVFASSPYVHVGGDEAYGVPEEHQRDLINHLHAYLRSRGRRTIVWEGPSLGEGDNKVATDVLHMNWRTIEFPAQHMLDAGYEVVNAAWDPMYIVDHYPRTMFTAVDLERCYGWDLQRFGHVDPGMPTFAKPHVTTTPRGIVGFCMPWWEGQEANLLPLCVPRLAAVGSAAWNRAGEDDFDGFLARYERSLERLAALTGVTLPALPVAPSESQAANLAYLATVTPSHGAHQPHFGPQRLTNGIPDRHDHFLGFPTNPDPLEIVIALRAPGRVGRIVVHENAVGESAELYELQVSMDGTTWETVGRSEPGARGEASFLEHRFEPRDIAFVRIVTRGCHGLTFPSFSRLTEVEAFAE